MKKSIIGLCVILIVVFGVVACDRLNHTSKEGKSVNSKMTTKQQNEVTSEAEPEVEPEVEPEAEPEAEPKVEPEVVFRLAEIHSEDFPTTLADREFARLVNERTNGRIKIEVYANGVLGDETEAIEKTMRGDLAFARVSVAPLANFVSKLNALIMPYLYKDAEHMWKVLDSSIGQNMLESVSNVLLEGLCWYDSGSRCFYANKKITTLEDMQGLAFRMQNSELMFDLCKALGALAVTSPQPEVVQLVKDGVVNGAENNIPTYQEFNEYKVCPYYILDNHSRIPEILVASQVIFYTLSEEDRNIIKECAKETEAFQREAWNQRVIESMAIIEQNNPEVEWVELAPGELEKFQEAVKPLYDFYGEEYKDIIEEIRAMGE